MAEDVYGEVYDDLLQFLFQGIDHLDSREAVAILHKWQEIVRKDMAHELAEWIHEQANKLEGYTTSGKWKQVADKIDPDKPPNSRRRGFWNQSEWNV